MKIENDQELFTEIDKILNSVQSKTRNNPEAAAYLDIYTKLIKIHHEVEVGNFSVESKMECNLSGPLAHLYDGQKELSMLGQSLCAINEYYQSANIKILNQEDAAEFFQLIQ